MDRWEQSVEKIREKCLFETRWLIKVHITLVQLCQRVTWVKWTIRLSSREVLPFAWSPRCNPRCRGFPVTKVAHTARDRAAELQAEVRSAIRVLGWCPRPPQGHARGETVLMSPQSQIRGNHGRNSGPPPQPPATVVVSSTSSMRPPPPPPPPRARTSNESKGHHEEPTSSIPDLGEESVHFSYYTKISRYKYLRSS